MEEGYIDEFDIKRIVSAVEHDMEIEPIEQPEVIVRDKDGSGTAHVVNIKALTCSCDDYEYNCRKRTDELADDKYCKHIYRVAFERMRML